MLHLTYDARKEKCLALSMPVKYFSEHETCEKYYLYFHFQFFSDRRPRSKIPQKATQANDTEKG